MEYGSLFGVAAVAALLVVLYWIYSFAIAPFRVLARYGIRGPSPVPFYGNLKMAAKMGRLKFIAHTIKTYGPIHGYVMSFCLLRPLNALRLTMIHVHTAGTTLARGLLC